MEAKPGKKPVIILIIDTLMDSLIQETVPKHKAPTLKFLIEQGLYIPDLISPFPTMSVNVDTTLLTGTYCNQHQLPGLVWFHPEERRLINYGTHIRELWRLGLGQSLEDILYNLNNTHISKQVTTIHEELEKKGQRSASINALIYRGSSNHYLKLPMLLKLFPQLAKNRPTKTARVFSYGGLSKINSPSSIFHLCQRYGFNNNFSIKELTHLINVGKVPSFSLVYLPDLDKSVHKNGRKDSVGLEKVDRQLKKLFNSFNSWEDALKQFTWIVMGDNGQAWIEGNKQKALIDLRKLYQKYKIMKLKKGVTSEDEVVLGVNERMTYIYSLKPKVISVEKLSEPLLQDNRVDVIAWKSNERVIVCSGMKEGEMGFQPNGEFLDEYGQSWSLEGDLEILDLTIEGKKIKYGEYPDALARLNSCLFSHEGDFLVASAKPGYEFIGEGSPTHVGGASHGGLHQQDSLVSLIITGTNTRPSHRRMVDLKDWVMSLIPD